MVMQLANNKKNGRSCWRQFDGMFYLCYEEHKFLHQHVFFVFIYSCDQKQALC